MLKRIITLLVVSGFIGSVFADVVQIKPDAPERHVVVKGDTLWDISAKFLKDPWRWPQIWNLNREQIKNPHWIYPGDVVVLDRASGTLRLLKETTLNKTVNLEPGIKIEALDVSAIPTISPKTIAPFLSKPLVIENGALDNAPIIVAGQENHVMLGQGVKAYISNISPDQGLNWQVYRPGKNLIDPETQELLGTEVVYLGDMKLMKYGQPATGMITSAKEEIFSEDKLVPANDAIPNSFVPTAPERAVQGRVLSVYGGVNEAGRNSVITINRGRRDGLNEGHVLAINRTGEYIKDPSFKNEKLSQGDVKELNIDIKRENETKTKSDKARVLPQGLLKLPDERVGLLMIFRTFERVSYALVMEASQPITVLDTVNNP